MKKNPFKENKHLLPPNALIKVGVLKKLASSVSQSDLNKYILVPKDLWRFIQPGESIVMTFDKNNKESYVVDNNIGINNSLTLCRSIDDIKSIYHQSMEEVASIHTKFSIQSILIIRLLKSTKERSDEKIQKIEEELNKLKNLIKKKFPKDVGNY